MKSFVKLLVFIFVLVYAAVCNCTSISESTIYGHEVALKKHTAPMDITNRKLKETNHGMKYRDLGSINEDDYPRYDPSPSSKASISSGPIEHGTPTMPFVPHATPPTHPKYGSPP